MSRERQPRSGCQGAKKGGRLALPLERLRYQVLDTQKIKAKSQIERRYTHERKHDQGRAGGAG